MANKVKCIECEEAMRFAIPSLKYIKENPDSYNWFKTICTKRLSCGRMHKAKNMNHEQYCKHFKEADECQKNYMLNAENEWNEKFSEIEK